MTGKDFQARPAPPTGMIGSARLPLGSPRVYRALAVYDLSTRSPREAVTPVELALAVVWGVMFALFAYAVGARTDADGNLQTATSPRSQSGIVVLIDCFLRLVATNPANG